MYKIELYSPIQISTLQEEWQALEKGEDMTYFQTYDWNRMLSEFVPKDNLFRESKIIAVYKDNKCVLIAPLLIIKRNYFLNNRGVYFMVRNDWSDYVNLIYSDFDPFALDFLFKELKKIYCISNICFENLRQGSLLYQYIKQSKHVSADNLAICVKLQIPHTEEEYMKMLSKGSRQNIRTAYNRMAKDGINYSVCFDDQTYDVNRCLFIRGQRSDKKRQNKGYSFVQKIKLKLLYNLLLYKLDDYTPLKHDKNSHVVSLYEGNKLRSYFNYGVDYVHKTIVVMVAGTDMEFSRYSPGIIAMFEFIKMQIANANVKYIDFTRGTERYKYDLGGEEHYIHNVSFTI